MKIIVLILFICPFIACAQQKESSAIRISGLNLSELIKGLMQFGYNIKKSEGSLQYIFTAPKKIGPDNLSTQLKAEIQKDGVVLYGQYAASEQQDFKKVESSDKSCEESLKCWRELQKLAVSFNKPVEYLQN